MRNKCRVPPETYNKTDSIACTIFRLNLDTLDAIVKFSRLLTIVETLHHKKRERTVDFGIYGATHLLEEQIREMMVRAILISLAPRFLKERIDN